MLAGTKSIGRRCCSNQLERYIHRSMAVGMIHGQAKLVSSAAGTVEEAEIDLFSGW